MRPIFSGRACATVCALVLALAGCKSDNRGDDVARILELLAVPGTLAPGETVTITWDSADASACQAGGTLPGWAGPKDTSGVQALTIGTAGEFVASLMCSDTKGNSDSRQTGISVAPQVAVTAFQAAPTTVVVGDSTTLTWTSSNATSCTGSGTLPGWAGPKATAGSQAVPVAAAGLYSATLTCNDTKGRSDARTVGVTGTQTAGTVAIDMLLAQPSDFLAGNTLVITWRSTNATICTGSGTLPGWTGALPVVDGDRTLLIADAGTYLAQVVCSDDNGNSATAAVPVVVRPNSAYEIANGCFALRSLSNDAYVVLTGTAFAASSASKAGGEPFFLKPTALGQYLLYTNEPNFMARSTAAVTTAAAPADTTVWTVETDPDNTFLTIYNGTRATALAINGSGGLVIADADAAGEAAKFDFDGTTGCAAYPELATNSTGQTFKGRGVDQPALGFADVHIHISATDFLGHAHYGFPFHPFGVEHALGDCSERHGADGHQDFVGNLFAQDPLAEHETPGWPTFASWPAADSLTHEGTYYKWLERAWKAGLRLAVNDVVENETLCLLQRNAATSPDLNCNEMDSAESQVYFMRALQDYIDAQEGGPGKGWLRIVTTPAEARAVINDGKLAVVLGIEISHLFNCGVYRVAGQELPVSPNSGEALACSEATIDQELDRLYNLGVRQMFPIHEFDNALGGNGIFEGLVLNLGNRYDTGEFWSTYDCPAADDPFTGGGYLYGAGAIMSSGVPPPQFFGNPIGDGLAANAGGVLPLYDTGTRQCNARMLTDLGRYAIRRMMERNIIVEVDHLELKVKEEVIDLARNWSVDGQPRPYPLVSTHGGHGGLSNKQARDILALGGIIYDSNNNGRSQVRFEDEIKPLRPANRLFGLGFGSDINGMSAQPGPRPQPRTDVAYPFTLFSGPDWGAKFTGIAPVTFDASAVPVDGGQAWNIDDDGIAHYGLVADFVEELRIEGGAESLDLLFDSAEAYLQMWERTVGTRAD